MLAQYAIYAPQGLVRFRIVGELGGILFIVSDGLLELTFGLSDTPELLEILVLRGVDLQNGVKPNPS